MLEIIFFFSAHVAGVTIVLAALKTIVERDRDYIKDMHKKKSED